MGEMEEAKGPISHVVRAEDHEDRMELTAVLVDLAAVDHPAPAGLQETRGVIRKPRRIQLAASNSMGLAGLPVTMAGRVFPQNAMIVMPMAEPIVLPVGRLYSLIYGATDFR